LRAAASRQPRGSSAPVAAGGLRDNARWMIYKFKSKASGDVIMLAPQGDRMLRLLGREPAPRGIIEPVAMPAAIEALEAAIREIEAEGEPPEDGTPPDESPVSLRRRLWPMIDMLRRAAAANVPVVWGV
jgi:hypothetical protein